MNLATGALAGLAVALVATRIVELVARRRQLLDFPNERSSHEIPTPRLGGVAIVAGTLAGMAVSGTFADSRASTIVLGASFVAAVGLVDDLRSTSVAAKLVAQIAAATGIVILLDPVVVVGAQDVVMITMRGPASWLMAIVWIVAICNVVNFMDGTDGIVAAYASVAAVTLGFVLGASSLFGALGAACLGFLIWNRAPASIFMGDTGSQFIGFTLGAGVLARAETTPLVVGSLVLAPMLFDTTLTLMRRVAAGGSVVQPHREHLYQTIADRWGHDAVAVLYAGAGVICGLAAYAYDRGLGLVAVALVPAVLVVLYRLYVLARDH